MKVAKAVAASLSVALCIVVSPLCSTHVCAGELKFAQISVQAIHRHSARLKAAIKDINTMRRDSKAKIGALSSDVKQLQDEIKSNKKTATPEDQKKLKRELQGKIEELQKARQDLSVKTAFKQKSIQNVLRSQIPIVLKNVAEKEGISAIFWKESLAYAPGIPDVSDKVAAALDAMPALEKGPEAVHSSGEKESGKKEPDKKE